PWRNSAGTVCSSCVGTSTATWPSWRPAAAESPSARRTRKGDVALGMLPDPDPRWRRVLLVGIPGAGKSTVGRELAAALDWDFLDVDAELVRRTGLSVAGYFEQHGEPAFRAEEARLTAELCSRD